MKKLFFALFLLCIAIPLFLIWCFTPKVTQLIISEDTTRITSPLTDDGQRVHYLKALEQRIYPPELATDDNGFRIFVRQFGDAGYLSDMPREEDVEFQRLQVYAKLGLDPDIPPTQTLPLEPQKIVEDFYEAKGEEYDKKQKSIYATPWTLDDYPMLADWMSEIDIPLDAIADMIRKPIFQAPLRESRRSYEQEQGCPDNLIAMLLPDVQMFRSIARHFSARANYRIAHGNIDGAIDDKLTLHRFGRLVPPSGGTLIGYLVGIAIERMAGEIPINANPEHPLTETQIRRILEGLDALPPRTSIYEAYEWERYVGLSALQDAYFDRTTNKHVTSLPWIISNFNLSHEMIGITERLRLSPFMRRVLDWNVVYRRLNEVYDALQQPPPLTEYHALLKAAEEGIQNAKGRSSGSFDDFIADALIALLLPAMEASLEATQRMECSDNIQRLALAILLYQCEHGMLPDEHWTTQIEKYLGEKPEQYFSCPTNPSPEGKTTYALVRCDQVLQNLDTLLLVELETPVPLVEALITHDEILERERTSKRHHLGGNVASHSGVVRFLANDTDEEELFRLLGREVAECQVAE